VLEFGFRMKRGIGIELDWRLWPRVANAVECNMIDISSWGADFDVTTVSTYEELMLLNFFLVSLPQSILEIQPQWRVLCHCILHDSRIDHTTQHQQSCFSQAEGQGADFCLAVAPHVRWRLYRACPSLV
jgi:hypothetical protein